MIYARNARLIAGVFILFWLAACSTPQTKALLQLPPAGIPARSELREVPYFAQDEYQCGPATLAMVFHTSRVNATPEQLKEYLYVPEKKGSLQVEMLATARHYGLLAYQLQPSLQDVLSEVAAGNPVIVLENLALSWYPMWHYAVVVGYDLEQKVVILRSGRDQRLLLPLSTFEHTWARSNYWAMLALPLARLPATALPRNLLQSLSALEFSSPATDTSAVYSNALQRWPHELSVQIAAGDHAYKQGDLARAGQIFRDATQTHPDSAAAFNNLAQTLSDQGQYEAARKAIRQALKIGGPLEPVVRQTLSEIEQKELDSLK